jgi:hypothetical protein
MKSEGKGRGAYRAFMGGNGCNETKHSSGLAELATESILVFSRYVNTFFSVLCVVANFQS